MGLTNDDFSNWAASGQAPAYNASQQGLDSVIEKVQQIGSCGNNNWQQLIKDNEVGGNQLHFDFSKRY